MNPPPPSPELRRLMDRLLDGSALTREESLRFERLLEDDDALACYVASIQQEELLPLALATAPACETRPSSFPWRGYLARMALPAAACLVFSLGFLAGRQPAGKRPAPEAPARITGLVGVEWENGSDPLPEDAVGKRLAFRTGLAELTYGNGVRVTVEGPADLTVTGKNSARLDSGKLVASVPKGAEGFTVDYGGGKVVDLGTEFALATTAGGPTELGVFDGKVELHRPGADVVSLAVNQSLLLDPDAEGKAGTIPFDHGKFVRRIPTRDFRWEIDGTGPVTKEFDVSHLVWKAADYRALFKWMQGPYGVCIRDVGLYLDGNPVSTGKGEGVTGRLPMVRDNMTGLPVSPAQYARGRWTVRATLEPLPFAPGRDLSAKPVRCVGIMQFEEGLVTGATAEDFLGTWTYSYDGKNERRTFLPDGSVEIFVNGKRYDGPASQGRWSVEDGILLMKIPFRNLTEEHVLRDKNTLIFVKNPYENATRSKDGGK